MNHKEQIFLDYIKARYQARLNPGHSGDEILDNYYFCNIKREWDKVSVYIRTHIIDAKFFRDTNIVMTVEDKLRNIFLARMHNKIETLEQYKIPQPEYNIIDEEILKKQNPHSYRTQRLLERLKQKTEGWNDSCWCLGNHLKKVLPDDLLKTGVWSSFKRAILSWSDVTGLTPDSFVVYQLSLDLDWLFGYKDIDSFYILGPGAIRGMNMIYYKEQTVERIVQSRIDKGLIQDNLDIEIVNPGDVIESCDALEIKTDYSQFSKEEFSGPVEGADYSKNMKDLQTFVNESEWAKENNIHIHINDIEFNLCEFNKYYSKKMGWKTTLRKYDR
jgi:hypothetical protein